MQYFDGELEKLIRAGTLDIDTGIAYSTNPGNLTLQLTDLAMESPAEAQQPAAKESDTELEIEP